jgi:LPS export ABC transporter protein LptC
VSRPVIALLLALSAAVACQGDDAVTPAPVNAKADSADQVLFGVRHNVTDAGLLRAKLVSDTGLIFDDGTRIELYDVNLTFFTTTGARNAVLTSREGTYRTRVGSMEARGAVLVVGEDGRRLSTEQLRYEPNRNQISSDSAFVLTEPGGRRLEGVGFVSDPDMNNIRILNRTGGSAGQVAIPGQAPGATPPQSPAAGSPSIVPPPARPPAGP